LSIDILFGSYHQAKASRQAFNIGFALSITGFVFPGLLLYLIIFWIGFTYMRSFGFKAFLASLFAVGMIYWLRFSYLAYTQKPDNIIEKLMQGWDNFYVSRILPVEKTETFVLSAIYVFAVLVVIFNGYVHRFDDKMQVRTNFLFLKYLLLFAVILHLFLFYYTSINLIIALVISGFILSHFFALAGKKWKVYFFILLLILYFANYAWIAVTSIELI
jgi:hypothetical protein